MTDEGKNMSTCTNTTCTGHWPPVYAATIKVPSNLNPGNFKNITVDGYKQTTYKGWPLYRFAGDKKPGDINGQGKLGVWSVVTP
jgi:predicted lipoprotein with Yx(FWY)xxD motif